MGFLKNMAARFIGKKVAKKLKLKEGPMDDKKKWYQSKGVWTGLVTIAVGLYQGVDSSLAPQLGFDLPEIPSIVFTLLGAMGIYSRAVAKTKLES